MTQDNSSLKILFVSRRFPPSLGGMERYAYHLYTALNNQISVSLIKWGGKNKWFQVALYPYFFVRASWVLLTKKIDVIHMQDGVLAPLGVALKFIFRKPLVVVIHGLDITYENKLFQTVVPWALKRADHVICISNATRDEVLKRGIDPAKTSFIPLGMSDELFMEDKPAARKQVFKKLNITDTKTPIILSFGRLVERKGVAWFIAEVLPAIKNKDPSALFLIAGDGEYKSQIEAAIQKSPHKDGIYLLGRVDEDYRKLLFNAADVFVMPNIPVAGDMEGFGIVQLEAALCEVPVVATGIEGIKDAIIDSKNGMLVAANNPEMFAKQVIRFLENANSAIVFGKAARKFTLEKYNWASIAEQFKAMYTRLK